MNLSDITRILWKKYASLIQFALVGALGLLINLLILYCCVEFINLHYMICAIISTGISLTINYFLNRHWTFKETHEDSTTKGLFKYYSVSIVGIIINFVILYVLVEAFFIWYIFGYLIAKSFSFLWNFFMNRKWTFKISN